MSEEAINQINERLDEIFYELIDELKQENQQLQNKVDKTKMISLQLRTHLSNWLFKEGYMGGERTKKLLDELDEILGGDLNE